MRQEDVPKVDSINLSTRKDELDWVSTIMDLAQKQGADSEGKVRIPVKGYPQLLFGLDFIVCQYVHEN
jgi:hypothetical protein